MKIARMTKGQWGKIRAFFDLQTDEGLVVKGFKLIEGMNGLFVAMPSEKKEEDYQDVCYFKKEYKHNFEQLKKIAKEEYDNQSSINQDVPEAIPELQGTKEQLDSLTIKTSDDIPF